jgi:hypothetical protein
MTPTPDPATTPPSSKWPRDLVVMICRIWKWLIFIASTMDKLLELAMNMSMISFLVLANMGSSVAIITLAVVVTSTVIREKIETPIL